MLFFSRRSAGVKVSLKVHRVIKRGDHARSLQDWGTAAAAYGEAVRMAPHLAHIFIQLGHAEKEAGNLLAACSAYAGAFAAKPSDVTPLILLGNLRIKLGEYSEAAAALRKALRIDPTHPTLGEALFSLLSTRHAEQSNLLSLFEADLKEQGIEGGLATAFRSALLTDRTLGQSRPDAPALLYDVTDLVRYFFWSRTLTGIQRVQVELVRAASPEQPPPSLLFFNQGRSKWCPLLGSEFDEIVALLSDPKAPAEQVQFAREEIKFKLLMRDEFEFRDGDCLIDLGGSWEFSNFFLALRAVRERAALRYSVFVHDLIPVVYPGRHVGGLGERFLAWVAGITDHADIFLTNSKSTKRDLIDVSRRLGNPIEPNLVEVVPLNAPLAVGHQTEPAEIVVPSTPFVLFVSTIEPRKGHVTAFDAWAKLVEKRGTDAPLLICVGKMGWLYEPILTKIRENPALKNRIIIKSDVSDIDLIDLYRSCLFTLYPSFYEGWGLPITESLSFGKIPILANTSSLPEAGLDFAVYFEAGDADGLCNAVDLLAFDVDHRKHLEQRIEDHYRPRTWTAIGCHIASAVAQSVYSHATPYIIASDEWYALTLPCLAGRIGMARAGERFRAGVGWLDPDNQGAPFLAEIGANLSVRLPEGQARWLHIRLLGSQTNVVRWHIYQNGCLSVDGIMEPEKACWASVRLDGPNTHQVHIKIFPLNEYEQEFRCRTHTRIIGFLINSGSNPDDLIEEFVSGMPQFGIS